MLVVSKLPLPSCLWKAIFENCHNQKALASDWRDTKILNQWSYKKHLPDPNPHLFLCPTCQCNTLTLSHKTKAGSQTNHQSPSLAVAGTGPFKCAIKAICSKCALGVPNMSAAKCQKSYISLYAQKGPEGFNWLWCKRSWGGVKEHDENEYCSLSDKQSPMALLKLAGSEDFPMLKHICPSSNYGTELSMALFQNYEELCIFYI